MADKLCSGKHCPMQYTYDVSNCKCQDACEYYTPITDEELAGGLWMLFLLWYLCEHDPEFKANIEEAAKKYVNTHLNLNGVKCKCEERKEIQNGKNGSD